MPFLLKTKIISRNNGENASNKMGVPVCADGDKNTAVFLFLSATLVLHVAKISPLCLKGGCFEISTLVIMTDSRQRNPDSPTESTGS